MFNMVFPVYFIINIYSKKFNIDYDCDLFIVLSNIYIGFGLIICSKLNVVTEYHTPTNALIVYHVLV